jgi:hypothetical protein
MADFIANIAKGAFVEKFRDGAALTVIVYDVGATTDATLKDLDFATGVLGVVTERASNGWTRKTIANGSITVTVDDTNDRTDIDVPDQLWTGVTAGNSTDLGFFEDTGADATRVFISNHDFAITPDGSDVQATIAAAGLLRAA